MLSPFLKKLLFARQLQLAEGKVELLGQEQVLVPMAVLVGLGRLNPEGCYDVMRQTIKESMALYAKRIGSTNEGLLKVMEEIFETYGFGHPEIIKLDNANKKAIIRIKNSPLTKTKKMTAKDTLLPAGSLAGMFSFLFKKDVDCSVKMKSNQMECTVGSKA